MTDLKHLYEVIAQEAIYGILVFTEGGTCTFINRVGKILLDQTSPDLESTLSLQDLIPLESRRGITSFNTDFLKNEGLYQDLLIRQGNNGLFIANVGCKHIHLAPGELSYMLTVQDVSIQKKMQREIMQKQIEIKAAHEELLKQNRRLKELDNAKNRFIALTTHELRTPLSAMCASIDILQQGLYDSPEQLREFIALIHEQGSQLQSLVNDILDFSKIQAGKMDYYIELQDSVQIAQKVFQSFAGMAEAGQIQMRFESPPNSLPCYFDPIRLRQILSNVVNNAVKFNRPTGFIRMHFTEDSASVKIHIEDSGRGIATESFDKVFNEFETVALVSNHQKGTGLGMPISRRLAQGMGGDLDFRSKYGVGSTFWVEIPKNKVLENESLYQARPESPFEEPDAAA